MYEAFYGMRHRPFSPIPQPECFVPLPQMADAIRDLRSCVERDQGIAVLTAPAGAGKTLLCKRLCYELADQYACAFLGTSRFPSRRALLQGILYELGQPYIGLSEQEARLGVLDALRIEGPPEEESNESVRHRHLLLVVDEAHLLPARFLEELRTLADYHAGGRPLIHVVLSGQLALEETLSEGPLSALNQRVGCHACIETLGADESAEYIRHRLAWAECAVENVFSPEALSLIVHAAEGNPRRINQLADHALLIAFAEEERLVSLETVQSALVDLRELPLQWNEPLALSWDEMATGLPTASDSVGEAGFAPSPDLAPSTVFEWGPETAAAPAATWTSDAGEGWGETDSQRFSFETEPTASGGVSDAAMESFERSDAAVFETGIPAQAREGSSDLMTSPFTDSVGYEEVVVDDRYARLDRRNESGGGLLDEAPLSDFEPAPMSIGTASELGADRSIEEELRDLLIAMQSEVAGAISPATSAAFPDGPGVYDVVEPEDEPVIDSAPPAPLRSQGSFGTVPFTPTLASFVEEEVTPASVPESLIESTSVDAEGTTEPPTRRYAHLFSRLQKQRSLMDVLLKRDRQ